MRWTIGREDSKVIGEYVEKSRIFHGLERSQVAASIGVACETVTHLEKGVPVTVENALKILSCVVTNEEDVDGFKALLSLVPELFDQWDYQVKRNGLEKMLEEEENYLSVISSLGQVFALQGKRKRIQGLIAATLYNPSLTNKLLDQLGDKHGDTGSSYGAAVLADDIRDKIGMMRGRHTRGDSARIESDGPGMTRSKQGYYES